MAMPGDLRAFNQAVVEEFRANNGKVDNEMLRDARLVLLTTTGLKSGRAHTIPLGDFSEEAGRKYFERGLRGGAGSRT